MFEMLLDLIGDAFIGGLPARQPWRGIVAAIYICGCLAGAALLVLFLLRAL